MHVIPLGSPHAKDEPHDEHEGHAADHDPLEIGVFAVIALMLGIFAALVLNPILQHYKMPLPYTVQLLILGTNKKRGAATRVVNPRP